MEPADLTPAERRVWQAFPCGDPVDFGAGDDRTVRAGVLRKLLLNEPPEPGEISALRLTGAHITGLLNLQYGEIVHPIRLMACEFDEVPNLYGAQTRQLNLSASRLPGLFAATIRVDGVLRLTDCRISGEAHLGGARVSGAVFLDGAHFEAGLRLNYASVGDDIRASRITAQAEVRLAKSRIEGTLTLTDAHISSPDGHALDVSDITVATFNAAGLVTEGAVRLTGARIAGTISLARARLSNPGGAALGGSRLEAAELLLWNAEPISGAVHLRFGRIDIIQVSPGIWPDKVRLEGLTYESLSPRLPAAQRLPLLDRDTDGFVPGSYEQLAASYRRIGDDSEARAVLLAKQRRHRSTLPWYAKAWGYAQDATVGYGFRPTRAMAWLLALLLVGAVAYGLDHPPPVEPGKGPTFNSTVYTLDLLLPIIDFGQEKAVNPTGYQQWLSYLLIAAGWILATTIAAGITRNLNRQ